MFDFKVRHLANASVQSTVAELITDDQPGVCRDMVRVSFETFHRCTAIATHSWVGGSFSQDDVSPSHPTIGPFVRSCMDPLEM